MNTNDRLNRLLRHYGLEEHEFPCGWGSHTSLDHLDAVAHIDTTGGLYSKRSWDGVAYGKRQNYFCVGFRVRKHENHAGIGSPLSFWLGLQGEQIENIAA